MIIINANDMNIQFSVTEKGAIEVPNCFIC